MDNRESEEVKRAIAVLDALLAPFKPEGYATDVLKERCNKGLEKCKETGKLSDKQYVFYKNDIASSKDEAYLKKTLDHLISIFKGQVV